MKETGIGRHAGSIFYSMDNDRTPPGRGLKNLHDNSEIMILGDDLSKDHENMADPEVKQRTIDPDTPSLPNRRLNKNYLPEARKQFPRQSKEYIEELEPRQESSKGEQSEDRIEDENEIKELDDKLEDSKGERIIRPQTKSWLKKYREKFPTEETKNRRTSFLDGANVEFKEFSSSLLEKFRKGARMVQLQNKLARHLRETVSVTENLRNPNIVKWKDLIEKKSTETFNHQNTSNDRYGSWSRDNLNSPSSPGLRSRGSNINSPISPFKSGSISGPPQPPPSKKKVPKLNCFSQACAKISSQVMRFIPRQVFSYLYSFIIIVSIFGDDIRRMVLDPKMDKLTDGLLLFIMGLFVLEIVYNICAKGGAYLFSPEVFIDSLATASMTIELAFISEPYLAPYGK